MRATCKRVTSFASQENAPLPLSGTPLRGEKSWDTGDVRGRHLWTCGTLLASVMGTATLLVVEPEPWHPTTAVIISACLVIWATVAVVAILLEHSRLGYRLGIFVLVFSAVIAVLHRISPIWWIAVALIAVSALLTTDPTLGGWVRQRTSAAPVPARAVVLALVLLTIPGLTALSILRSDPGSLSILVLLDLVLLFAYVRRPAFALAAVRIVPLGLAIAGLTLAGPGRWVWISGQLAALPLAWTREVRLAIRPLIERGTKVIIPPELAPAEIREMLEGKG